MVEVPGTSITTAFTPRDLSRLHGVHPELIRRLNQVFVTMSAAGFPLFVVVGVRTILEQQALYAQGRTAPGPIVTHCDGVFSRSNHQPHPDGFGHAVDCAFAGVPQPFASTLPWTLFGEKVQHQGLVWGGTFQTQRGDLDHAELPDTLSA